MDAPAAVIQVIGKLIGDANDRGAAQSILNGFQKSFDPERDSYLRTNARFPDYRRGPSPQEKTGKLGLLGAKAFG